MQYLKEDEKFENEKIMAVPDNRMCGLKIDGGESSQWNI